MKQSFRRLLAQLAFAAPLVLLLASGAQAYSFLGGAFPNKNISSVQLSANGTGGAPAFVVWDTGADMFDISDDSLTFESSVTTINFTDGTQIGGIPLGHVLVQSTVEIDFQPFTSPLFVDGGLFGFDVIGAQMLNGQVADITITDIGGAGQVGLPAGVLLAADYTNTVEYQINEQPGNVTSGSLAGDFSILFGDAAFLAAFGPLGNFFSNLSGFRLGDNGAGAPITDPCPQMTAFGACLPNSGTPDPFTIDDLLDHTSNPTTTIIPLPIPEPSTLLLVGVGLGILALPRSRRH